MKKLILGALICLSGVASHANGPQLSGADRALLSNITQAQYQAMLYATVECGFDTTPTVAVALLKSPALAPLAAAMARVNEPAPLLDEKACASFGLPATSTARK
jgi:hypothetical protein